MDRNTVLYCWKVLELPFSTSTAVWVGPAQLRPFSLMNSDWHLLLIFLDLCRFDSQYLPFFFKLLWRQVISRLKFRLFQLQIKLLYAEQRVQIRPLKHLSHNLILTLLFYFLFLHGDIVKCLLCFNLLVIFHQTVRNFRLCDTNADNFNARRPPLCTLS